MRKGGFFPNTKLTAREPASKAPKELKDSSIEKHDRFNFEVKLDYQLEKELKSNKYEVDTYFFIPHSLQINKQTYSHDEFFADVNNYIRFKTPQMALSGLLNKENLLSPFSNIYSRLEDIKNGKIENKIFKRINYELRLLGSIVKSTLRDQIDYYKENSKQIIQKDYFRESFLSFLDKIKDLQSAMQRLEQDFALVQLPSSIRKSFVFVDKYISLQILDRSHKLLKIFQTKNLDNSTIVVSIMDIINYEKTHETEIDSNFELDKDSENERYSYWEGMLKKFIQNVLYLENRPNNEKSKAIQFLYSIAAGLAMFFSVFLGFVIVEQFADNIYAYMALLIVVYMGKDRLKDWFRHASNRFVEKFFPDRTFEIWDAHSDKSIGKTRESMRFISWSQIPPEIVNIREASARTTIEREGKPENVFKFVKTVDLYTREIQEYHERHGDVNDIMRFNIRHLLQYADDPYQYVSRWNPSKNRIEKYKCAKVYHINVILKLRSIINNKRPHYKKIRVIIDQRGIKRVEEPDIQIPQ